MTGPRRGASVAKQADAAERHERAVQLSIAGKTYQEIADTLGYASRGAAHDAVRAALKERREKLGLAVDEYRERENERLQAIQDLVWKIAQADHLAHSGGKIVTRVTEYAKDPGGNILLDEDGRPLAERVAEVLDHGPNLAAAAQLVRISESLRKLHGLDAPAKVAISGTVQHQYGVEIEAV